MKVKPYSNGSSRTLGLFVDRELADFIITIDDDKNYHDVKDKTVYICKGSKYDRSRLKPFKSTFNVSVTRDPKKADFIIVDSGLFYSTEQILMFSSSNIPGKHYDSDSAYRHPDDSFLVGYRWGHYVYIEEYLQEIVDVLSLSSSPVISTNNLNKFFSNRLMTRDDFNNLNNSFTAIGTELSLELLAMYDLKTSYFYICMLMSEHYNFHMFGLHRIWNEFLDKLYRKNSVFSFSDCTKRDFTLNQLLVYCKKEKYDIDYKIITDRVSESLKKHIENYPLYDAIEITDFEYKIKK